MGLLFCSIMIFEYKVYNVITEECGCFIIMDIAFLNKRVTLVNDYGPRPGDQPIFFDTITNHIGRIGNDCALLLRVIGKLF